MRPVGLRDPRTGHRPWAVVQLRQDNVAGTLYNIVGFQTNIKWGDQERVLRMIPGLEEAEFVRFGQMHRNTFINSPVLLRPTLQWHDRDDLFFAGQITGHGGLRRLGRRRPVGRPERRPAGPGPATRRPAAHHHDGCAFPLHHPRRCPPTSSP